MNRHRSHRSQSKRQLERRWMRQRGLIVFILLLIGLFASVLAYISDHSPSTETEPESEPGPRVERRKATATVPKYDFYQTLEKREVVIGEDEPKSRKPEPEAVESAKAKPPSPPVKASPSVSPTAGKAQRKGTGYLIQAGAFSKRADADRIKARLALLGIKARVELGISNNNRVHRVRIGPIPNEAQMVSLRQRLRANQIDSIPIKLK